MVPLGEEESNSQGYKSSIREKLSLEASELNKLFETLSDWEQQLQHLESLETPDAEHEPEEPTP